MGMFCYQCQETVGNNGCTVKGVCGKTDQTAGLQDLLVWVLESIAELIEKRQKPMEGEYGNFITEALFVTITNANFDEDKIFSYIEKALEIKDEIKREVSLADACSDEMETLGKEELIEKAKEVGVSSYDDNEDKRSLKSLMLYGVKGIAAYSHHASVLGSQDSEIYGFLIKALSAMIKDLSVEELISLVMETGNVSVKTMALLDEANTSSYGSPEMTEVNIGVRKRPGILVSGHDLKDMEELLQQAKEQGVDVYTHSEMLPANYYPAFKKFDNLAGNYGNAWWKQAEEFESFNGPIVMTTNCIIPVRDSYKNRIFTTGAAGYPGVKHIPSRADNGSKVFSEVIELAKKCSSPSEIETGSILGGFAHGQLAKLADKVVEAVKSGKIKKFVVMAGCDGRFPSREYFTGVASKLPEDTVILTAGCAKYRYNKLNLGDIDGIPRVLDAGQCNDSYSLAVIALKLKEIFDLEDVNDLPIAFDIAWYEQKAVCVLLALLSLGFKSIRLGPTIPAFLSQNVVKVLQDKFDIKPTLTVEEDVEAITA